MIIAEELTGIDGRRLDPGLMDGKAVLVVNVASRCGLTPQYVYERLTVATDADGRAGEVEWNFEKFLVSPAGDVVARFRPQVEPEDVRVTRAIERVLP